MVEIDKESKLFCSLKIEEILSLIHLKYLILIVIHLIFIQIINSKITIVKSKIFIKNS
jgi:hypothetical protein